MAASVSPETATSNGPTRRSRLESWFRSADHQALVALLFLFVALALVYSRVIPFFEGPDANAHFRYITYLRQEASLPMLDAETAAISHELVQQPPLYYALAALLTPASLIEAAQELDVANPFFGEGMSRRASITIPAGSPWAALPIHIARWVSMLGGLLTVLGTWLLVRELLPDQPWAALAAASVAGLNPQFLFSAATVTNDTWVAALFVCAVWLAVRFSQRQATPAHWLLAGLCAGLTALTKYSGLLVLGPIGLVMLYDLRSLDWRPTLKSIAWFGLGFLAVAGLWYGRNLFRWGALAPLDEILALLPGLKREAPLPMVDVLASAKWLLRSYWGVFGYGIIAPAAYHGVIQNIILVAVGGLLILPLRTVITRELRVLAAALLALVWFVLVYASLLNWMRLVLASDQGRLLFPAVSAVAILIVIGLQTWLPAAWQVWLHRAIPLLFLALALSQIPTLVEGYRMPPAIEGDVRPDRPLNADFEGGMTLVGVDMPDGAAIEPGQTLPITLYFTAREPIYGFYTLFIHLSDDEDNLLYQFDGVAADGRHATRQWRPGEIFADTHEIVVENLADLDGDLLGTLSLGFYDIDDRSSRKAVLNPDGGRGGDRVIVPIRVHATPSDEGQVAAGSMAEWRNGIRLNTATVERGEAGLPFSVALTWTADRVIHDDATVFVQVLDEAGQIIAQVDRKPQNGSFPTSTWRSGDVIDDVYGFDGPTDGWAKIIVGLYTADGQRLQRADDDGVDHVVIATRDAW